MSDTPSRNVLVQRLQVLLSGGGYNFYDRATRRGQTICWCASGPWTP